MYTRAACLLRASKYARAGDSCEWLPGLVIVLLPVWVILCVYAVDWALVVRWHWRLQQQQYNLSQRTGRQTMLEEVLARYDNVLYLHPHDFHHAYQPSYRNLQVYTFYQTIIVGFSINNTAAVRHEGRTLQSTVHTDYTLSIMCTAIMAQQSVGTRQSPIRVLTRPSVQQPRWLRPSRWYDRMRELCYLCDYMTVLAVSRMMMMMMNEWTLT